MLLTSGFVPATTAGCSTMAALASLGARTLEDMFAAGDLNDRVVAIMKDDPWDGVCFEL